MLFIADGHWAMIDVDLGRDLGGAHRRDDPLG